MLNEPDSQRKSQRIRISIGEQMLRLYSSDFCQLEFSVSTARNGAGELKDSEKTPRGAHYIRAKIGAGLPELAVLSARRFTGELYSEALAAQFPERDWILTRILWLSGMEIGKNRLGNVDSMQRYIYIHGTPDTEPMGEPMSHGCIRMRNAELIQLFDAVTVGCPVQIEE